MQHSCRADCQISKQYENSKLMVNKKLVSMGKCKEDVATLLTH